jgi:hypothetical protein
MSGFRQLLQNGPFVRMTVSRNGKLIACFTEAGTAARRATSLSSSSSPSSRGLAPMAGAQN